MVKVTGTKSSKKSANSRAATSNGAMECFIPVLHRLEREKLIESEWKEADSGRERKYYSLSSEGKKTLVTEREQWLKVHNTLCKLWKIKPALT